MQYLILVYKNPSATPCGPVVDESPAETLFMQTLAESSQVKCVSVRDGTTITSEGPVVVGADHLAGFMILECASIDCAIQHAARVPEARHGLVEIRPIARV